MNTFFAALQVQERSLHNVTNTFTRPRLHFQGEGLNTRSSEVCYFSAANTTAFICFYESGRAGSFFARKNQRGGPAPPFNVSMQGGDWSIFFASTWAILHWMGPVLRRESARRACRICFCRKGVWMGAQSLPTSNWKCRNLQHCLVAPEKRSGAKLSCTGVSFTWSSIAACLVCHGKLLQSPKRTRVGIALFPEGFTVRSIIRVCAHVMRTRIFCKWRFWKGDCELQVFNFAFEQILNCCVLNLHLYNDIADLLCTLIQDITMLGMALDRF